MERAALIREAEEKIGDVRRTADRILYEKWSRFLFNIGALASF